MSVGFAVDGRKQPGFKTPLKSSIDVSPSVMPTELPYAADAEVSLAFDELEVCIYLYSSSVVLHLFAGASFTA